MILFRALTHPSDIFFARCFTFLRPSQSRLMLLPMSRARRNRAPARLSPAAIVRESPLPPERQCNRRTIVRVLWGKAEATCWCHCLWERGAGEEGAHLSEIVRL
jgi:hypothetical protein